MPAPRSESMRAARRASPPFWDWLQPQGSTSPRSAAVTTTRRDRPAPGGAAPAPASRAAGDSTRDERPSLGPASSSPAAPTSPRTPRTPRVLHPRIFIRAPAPPKKPPASSLEGGRLEPGQSSVKELGPPPGRLRAPCPRLGEDRPPGGPSWAIPGWWPREVTVAAAERVDVPARRASPPRGSCGHRRATQSSKSGPKGSGAEEKTPPAPDEGGED